MKLSVEKNNNLLNLPNTININLEKNLSCTKNIEYNQWKNDKLVIKLVKKTIINNNHLEKSGGSSIISRIFKKLKVNSTDEPHHKQIFCE